jgi:predicted DNA-binding protein (MmcQ/YjbR family)
MTAKKVEAALRAYALSLPGAVEEFPWGDRVMKVNKKVFVFMGSPEGGGFGMSTKLPKSAAIALTLPFAEPTGYGLGKSGWVSARFAKNESPPLDMMKAWIEESYRAIAPKKLVAALDAASKR